MRRYYYRDWKFVFFKVIFLLKQFLIGSIEKFKGGPVGISTLATAVGENAETIEEVYEPFLIQEGFIMRTPRGREVTDLTYKHLGRVKGASQEELF